MAESMRFKPHFNAALGKYYYSSRDYVEDMRKKKLEPYREVEDRKPTAYKMDQSGIEMVRQAADYQRRKVKPGGRFIKALNDLGIAKKPKWLTDSESMVGGFKGEVND